MATRTGYIALLRALNVGGTKKIAMADLRAFAVDLGMGDVRSIIATGNLLFASERSAADLERLLEAEAEKRLGLRTEFFVRDVAQWESAIRRNPFAQATENDPAHLVVVFLKKAPAAAAARALEAAIVGPEVVRLDGKQLYAVYPAGIGESRLTARLIERKLDTTGTARNWNTILKLRAAAVV
ncbi:MAG TPA: DUF1697 domain-containing protein [Verrucomicrobiae bacterium]|jgi:uncharacterized protein (DUF1697 family)|nr:DUF1697 domain-containing protein [Verrucomicrobiae bacterium]